MPEKWPLFLDFTNSHLPLKKYTFFAKMGMSMDVSFGLGGWGLLYMVIHKFHSYISI